MYETDRENIYKISQSYSGGGIGGLHQRLTAKFKDSTEFERLTGLVFSRNWKKLGVPDSGASYNTEPAPAFQIINLRAVSRVGPDSNQLNQIVFSIVQKSGVLIEDGVCTGCFQPTPHDKPPPSGMVLRGGCTLIFDLDTLMLRYAISRPLIKHDERGKSILDTDRAVYEHCFRSEHMEMAKFTSYFGSKNEALELEPFAFLHKH